MPRESDVDPAVAGVVVGVAGVELDRELNEAAGRPLPVPAEPRVERGLPGAARPVVGLVEAQFPPRVTVVVRVAKGNRTRHCRSVRRGEDGDDCAQRFRRGGAVGGLGLKKEMD